MAVGDAAGAAGLVTYGDDLLVTDIDVAVNQRGDELAAALTRIKTLEAAAINKPMFSVVRSTNGQSVGDSTWSQMVAGAWATPVKNVGGFTWSAGVLTVPRAGVYGVVGTAHFYSDDYTALEVQITKNTTSVDTTNTVSKAAWSAPTKSGETGVNPSVTTVRLFVPFNAGDTLRFWVLQRNVNGQTWNTGPRPYDLTWDVEWKDSL